jgi:putative transposase
MSNAIISPMSTQLYTYKFALKPTKLQAILLNKHCGAVRYLYNYFLKVRHNNYILNKELPKEEKKYINYYDQARELSLLKQDYDTGWLKEINSQTLQFGVKALDGAYNDFFRGKTALPSYHSKNRSNSFRIPQSVSIIREGNDNSNQLETDQLETTNKIKKSKLKIPKFLEGIELIEHREVIGDIKFATITHNPDNTYHVSITVEREIEHLPPTGNQIGIDIGIKDTFVTSQGSKTGNPKAIAKYQKKIAFFQKRFSRLIKLSPKKPLIRNGKQVFTVKNGKGNNGNNNTNTNIKPKFYTEQTSNTKKASLRLAKYHTKVKNRRSDHIHKATTHIVRNNDLIVLENLNTKGMVRNHKLAKSIHDASFGEVGRQLEYKANWYGRKVIKIDRWFPSSKTCSHCAYVNHDLKLKDRNWTCKSCGKYHDRDTNAAINILAKGISMLVGTQA